MFDALKDRLAELVKTYENLHFELWRIERDFGFKYELGDVEKWISIGKRYEEVKEEIVKVLSEFLELLEKKAQRSICR